MREQGVESKISIGTAYSEGAAVLRHEKRLLAPLVLALLVVPVTVSQLVQPSNPFAGPDGFGSWMAIAILALLVQLVGQMAISRLAMGWNGSLGEAISLGLRRMPAAVGGLLLYFLCLALLLVPLNMVLMIGGAGGAQANPASALTLIAMFIAGPRIMLAPAIAMNERLGPWALVKRTWAASRGHYARLLGFFMLFLAASIILALAVSAVIGSLATLAFGAPEPMSVSRLLMALAGGLVQGIAATLYAAMLGRIVAQLAPGSSKGI
jgi:hypothetical protein